MTIDPADLFRSLHEHATETVLAVDLEGRVVTANPAAERMFASDGMDLVGRRFQSLFADPRDFDRLARTHLGELSPSDSAAITERYRARAGQVFDGETLIRPIQSSDGERSGFLCLIRNVGEQRTLRARLEASDIQLRAALSSAKEGAYTLNLETRLGSIRGFINEFLGIPATDATISQSSWLEHVHPDDREGYEEAIESCRRKPGEPMDITYRARRVDGEYRWLHDRGRITEFSRDGQALRLSGVLSDVTDRELLERRLAESERMLRQAVNTTHEGAWQIDFRQGSARVTGLYCRLLGSSGDDAEITRKIWFDLIHPEDRHIALSAGERLAETDDLSFSCRVRTPEGEWIWLNNRGRVTERDSDGRPWRASGLCSDITERKKLEDLIEDSERLLREAMEGAQYGAWSLHLPSRSARFSGMTQRLLGGQGGASVKTGFDAFLDLLTPDSRMRAEADIERLLAGLSVRTEYELIDPDGHLVCIHHEGRVVERNDQGEPIRAAGISSDITEQHHLRSQVDESERRLRAALAAAGEGAWRLNLRTGIADISSVISEMMGLPPQDARVSLDDWSDRLEAEDQARSRAYISDMKAGARGQIDEIVRYRSETGGWIRLHNRGQVSEWSETGEPVMATGFMTDVTERLDLTARLAERENQLADAVEAADVSIWRIDTGAGSMWLRGTIVETILAETRDATISHEDWMSHVHPDDRPGLEAANLQLLRGETEKFDHGYRLRTPAGEWTWVRATGRVTGRDDDGRVTIISGAVLDIDRETRLTEALIEEKRRFEQIYRATPAMLHTIDADGVIMDVSDYWLSNLGYERDEVIGQKSVDFLDPESSERARNDGLPKLFETGENTNIPYRFIRKNGEILDAVISSYLERDDQGEPVRSFAVMTDITPLRAAYEQLERSNRELDRFATVASHDLQEPLRKISAFSSLVRRRYSDALDDDGKRCLDFLVDAAQRMQGLIDDLLLYSKMSSQALEMDAIDLTALIDHARENLDTQISESGARFEIGDLPSVRGDQLLLGQVMQNLISNAVKYRGSEAPVITISAERQEANWVIAVADNGIGLDPRFADKIFSPFQRLHTREEYLGTGIGLAIVRQAIERHGGTVWVDSKPDQGACFHFTLPAPKQVGLAS